MHDDYYQNIVYPLQDKVLNIVAELPVEFYLTGGTALSRAYLNHRYSDDLDFFLNNSSSFKSQVNMVINALKKSGILFETAVADEGYARLFVFQGEHALKLDFVNDVSFRSGTPEPTKLFGRTDNLFNILSNKITALGRYSPKDVVDIIYLCEFLSFYWKTIFNDATEKKLWVNPINAAEVLEKFPVEKIDEITWLGKAPSYEWITDRIKQIITGILDGSTNTPNPS